MDNIQYVFPYFSPAIVPGIRIGGAGLGNLLFSFGRALILSKNYNLTIINPSWPSLKIGPWVRREKNKRFYWDLFKPIGVNGIKKQWLLSTYKKIPEDTFLKHYDSSKSFVCIVSGLGNYFIDLKTEHIFLKKTFLNLLSPSISCRLKSHKSNCIGAHLRLGDFQREWRVSAEWFCKTIEKIRFQIDKNIPVLLFTDGDNDEPEIKKIGSLKNVQRVDFGNPLSDMLALSMCNVILASNSTFSAWAAFLGQKPVIWAKRNQELENLMIDTLTFEGIVSIDEALPDLLIQNIELSWKI